MLLLGLDILLIISTYFVYKELYRTSRIEENPINIIDSPPKYEDINGNNNPPSYS